MDQRTIELAKEAQDKIEAASSPLERSCDTCSLLSLHSDSYYKCNAEVHVPANIMMYLRCDDNGGRLIPKERLDRWPKSWFRNCYFWKEKDASIS